MRNECKDQTRCPKSRVQSRWRLVKADEEPLWEAKTVKDEVRKDDFTGDPPDEAMSDWEGRRPWGSSGRDDEMSFYCRCLTVRRKTDVCKIVLFVHTGP